MDEQVKQHLITELGLGALSPAEQDQALEKVGGMIFQSVFLRIAQQLNPDQQKELEKMLVGGTPNPETLFTFLKNNVPNFEQLVKEEVDRFKQESATIMGKLGQK